MSAAVREINIEKPKALLRYLRERQLIAEDEFPRFEILAGGVSNRTVLVQRERGKDWVLKQALAKLRVEVDWFSAPERIHREANGLRWLGKVAPGQVPRFLFEDDTRHILGMTAVPQPHENWKQALLKGKTDQEQARSFGRLLAKIHNAALTYPELCDEFSERRFFEELRLEPYYAYTASQAPAAYDFLQGLIAETRERKLALAHGDYSPKNVLLHDSRLILLDHEVIHFGDPAFDIGFSLTHLLAKALRLPRHRSDFLAMARAYWRSYADSLSSALFDAVQGQAARHTLACMLARVAGRSPLEYLDADERCRLQQVALALIAKDLADIEELLNSFEGSLARS